MTTCSCKALSTKLSKLYGDCFDVRETAICRWRFCFKDWKKLGDVPYLLGGQNKTSVEISGFHGKNCHANDCTEGNSIQCTITLKLT